MEVFSAIVVAKTIQLKFYTNISCFYILVFGNISMIISSIAGGFTRNNAPRLEIVNINLDVYCTLSRNF